MDTSDEVYSELDFQQEENKNVNDDLDDDDYIEDEFEESKENNPLANAAKNGISQQPDAVAQDLGSVAKVAKKEGVLEVVEVDDGQEKALSGGSAFSEISVKDEEAQEEAKYESADAQILLDDQSETRTENQNHVKGAVKQVSPARLNLENEDSGGDPHTTRPLSMVDQQPDQLGYLEEEQKGTFSNSNPSQHIISETTNTIQGQREEEAITQFKNNVYSNGIPSASSNFPDGATQSIPIDTSNYILEQDDRNNNPQTLTERTENGSKPIKAIQTAHQTNSSINDPKISDKGKSTIAVKQSDQMITSHDPVLVVGAGEQDMFSSDFQLASGEQPSRINLSLDQNQPHFKDGKPAQLIGTDGQPKDSSARNQGLNAQSQQLNEEAEAELVAASSGAMPETFREDSPESMKPPLRSGTSQQENKQSLNQPVQWEKRVQKGLRAPRTNQVNPLKFSKEQTQVTQSTQGQLRPNGTATTYGNNHHHNTTGRRKNQLSLNRQESEVTYGTAQSIGSQIAAGKQMNPGNRTSKAADQRPAWGGSGVIGTQNNRQRIQTAQGMAPKPQYPLKPVRIAPGSVVSSQTMQVPGLQSKSRQASAYEKFVTRGAKSVNRNSGMLYPMPTGALHTQPSNQKPPYFPQNKTQVQSKFMSTSQQKQHHSRSTRPNTSSAIGNTNLPQGIHPGQRRGEIKSRYMLQSANNTTKHIDANRLNSQKHIKVPQSQYGLKPVTQNPSQQNLSSKRPSATTQQFTRLNSSAKSFYSKEASVKQLRMGSYMRSDSAQRRQQQSFSGANTSTGFQHQQRSQSRTKNNNYMSSGKSPMTKSKQSFSASRVASQSRVSLDQSKLGGQTQYPTINFKGDEDFAIKILDNMIQVEEDMQKGFSMYNRGKNLKKSLINPERVREYLMKVEKGTEIKNFADEQDKCQQNDQLISLEDQSEDGLARNMQIMPMPKVPEAIQIKGDPDLIFLQDNHIDEDKQWRLMLDYFKKNPDALMDAIPTPPGQDEDDKALADFRTGLTPKRGKAFKFGGSKIVNRPNYDEEQRQAWGNMSQMSARSNSSKKQIYQQSPRIGSARSNHSRQNSASRGPARFNPNTSNQYSNRNAQFNRSYSSQMSRQSNNSKLKAPQSRGTRNGQRDALNRSTSSVNSGVSASKKYQLRTNPLRSSTQTTGGGPYGDRVASGSTRRAQAVGESSTLQQHSQRSIKQQKDFRISKPSARTVTSQSMGQTIGNQQVKSRLHDKQQEEQKKMEQKRQHTDRMRNMLKKNNGKNSTENDNNYGVQQKPAKQSNAVSKQASMMSSSTQMGKQSQLTSNKLLANKNAANPFASKNKKVLDYIDWKQSYFYKQVIVRHVDDNQKWESEQHISDDQSEYVMRMIRNYKVKKTTVAADEVLHIVPQMIKKCYNTIEMIYKEMLTNDYWRIEYDQMRENDPHVCKTIPRHLTSAALKIITLENLLIKVQTLKAFRKELRTFFELIHSRELVLKQMHIAVESIQTEDFFMSQEDLEANRKIAQNLDNTKTPSAADAVSQQNPRQEMLAMGNNLVDLTDQIIKQAIKFIKNFNKQFLHVRLEQLIFQEADYIDVAIKEVEEIGQIFLAYEIQMNKLKNSQLYLRPENHRIQELKDRLQVRNNSSKNTGENGEQISNSIADSSQLPSMNQTGNVGARQSQMLNNSADVDPEKDDYMQV